MAYTNYALLSSTISIHLLLIYTSSVASDWIFIQKDGIADKAATVFLKRFATKNGLACSTEWLTDAVRIGKKPNEADLSYTTIRTGLTKFFFGTYVWEESEGKETREREYP